MARTSQAQLDASKRWREKNKVRVTYSDYRSALNGFAAGTGKISEIVGNEVEINEYVSDLEMLYDMVNERIKELE